MAETCKHEWELWISDIVKLAFKRCKHCGEWHGDIMEVENAQLRASLTRANADNAALRQELGNVTGVISELVAMRDEYGNQEYASSQIDKIQKLLNSTTAGASLLAELESKDKRIAELERIKTQLTVQRNYWADEKGKETDRAEAAETALAKVGKL